MTISVFMGNHPLLFSICCTFPRWFSRESISEHMFPQCFRKTLLQMPRFGVVCFVFLFFLGRGAGGEEAPSPGIRRERWKPAALIGCQSPGPRFYHECMFGCGSRIGQPHVVCPGKWKRRLKPARPWRFLYF